MYYLRGATYRFRGNQLHNLAEYERAVDDFTHAIELDPHFSASYYSRGVLYWRELRNAYRAIRDLTRVMEIAPALAEAWFNRAQAHQMRGDYHLAIADLEQYLAIGRDDGWRTSAQTQLALLRELNQEKEARRAKDKR
jgi:tetratricopeptide (TPR) repeat protein